MTAERDEYGKLVDPAEAGEEFLFRLFDLMDDGELAGFSSELLKQLDEVRIRFVGEFENKYPDRGKGRSVWR